MFVRVITINLEDGKQHDERIVNLKNPAGQRWLINHMNWAVRNKHGLQILNKDDAPPCQS